MLVHGDDFVTVARAEGRAYVEQTLRSQYEIKVDLAGPEANDPKELKVLGRIITYEAHGITYEAYSPLGGDDLGGKSVMTCLLRIIFV